MGLKLYGPLLSNNVARVEMTLLEKGVTDFESVEVDMMSGAHKKPEYLALHIPNLLKSWELAIAVLSASVGFAAAKVTRKLPFGKVPAITDGDLTLFESRAICRYVAHKFEGQGTPLYGLSPREMALVEQWMEVESQNCNPPMAGLNHEKVGKVLFMGAQPDEAKVAACTEQLGKVLDVYETHLKDSKYLAGDFFSLADLSHLPTLMSLFTDFLQMGDLINSRPHLRAWWEDISSRPTWKKLSERINEEMKAWQGGQKAN